MDEDIMFPKRNSSTVRCNVQARKIKTYIEKKLSRHYGSHFFSLPSSYLSYKLVRELGKVNNNYIWFGAVGLTSAFL